MSDLKTVLSEAVAAAFALAERMGGVDGREFLTAVVAGAEVVARLQMAVRSADDGTSEAKPQPTQFLGAFAAAVTCARGAGAGTPVGKLCPRRAAHRAAAPTDDRAATRKRDSWRIRP